MTAALRYEWRRISSIRSTWILAAVAILLAVGMTTIIAVAVEPGSSSASSEGFGAGFTSLVNFAVANFLVWVPLGTIAAQTFGQEYRHGTIRVTLTAFPKRDQVFWAKAIMSCAVIVVVMLASVVICSIILIGSGFGTDGQSGLEICVAILRSAINLIGFCLIVFGITLITRVLALGVVIPLLFSLVVEGIVVPTILLATGNVNSETGSVSTPWWSEVLPFGAGTRFADGTDIAKNGLIYLLWVVVIAAIGYVLFKKRDA